MAGNVEFGITLTADGRAFVGTLTVARQEVEKIAHSAQQSGAKIDSGMRQAGAGAQMLLGMLRQLIPMLSVGALIQWTGNVINAAAALDDLADSTGSTVEALSRLDNIAKVSGVGAEKFGFALNKLAAGLNGVEDETGQAAKALKTLGVTAQDPAQALEQLAQNLDKYADGPNKVAAMMAIFGREGAKLLPLMKEIVRYKDVDATVTAEQAMHAERLQQQWAMLQIELGALRDAIMSSLVPAVADLIERWRLLIDVMGGFKGAWSVAFDVAMNGGIANIGPLIKETTDEANRLKSALANWNAFDKLWGDSAKLTKELGEVEAKLRGLIALRDAQIMSNVRGMGYTGDARDEMAWRPKPKPQLAFNARTTKQEKDELNEFDQLLQKVTRDAVTAQLALDAMFSTEPITAARKELELLKASDVWEKLSKEEQEYYEGVYKTADATEKMVAKMKDWASGAADYAEQRKKEQDEYNDKLIESRDALDAYIVQVELEAKTLSMTSDQRELYLAELEAEKLFYAGVIPDLDAYIQRLRDASAARATAKQAAAAAEQHKDIWVSTYNEITGSLTDAFVDAFHHAKDAASIFKNWLKNAFDNFVLRPIIQAIVAPIGNAMSSMLTPGVGAAGGGGSSIFGALGNFAAGGFDFSSLLMNGSAMGGFGGMMGGLPFVAGAGPLAGTGTGLAGALAGAGMPGLAGFAAGMGSPLATLASGFAGMSSGIGFLAGAGGLAATLGAAVPIIGIAAALYFALKKPRGGPKTGGSYSDIPGAERFFTPNDQDDTAREAVKGITGNFADLVQAMGGTSTGLFGLGFDADPRGTANSRVSASAMVNGQLVYNARDVDAGGRDEEAVSQALELEGKRAILAALQASDLPDLVKRFLSTVAPGSATAEAIDNVVALGQAVGGLVKILDEDVGTAAEDAWKTMSQTGVEALGDLRQEVIDLSAEYDGTLESTEELLAATSSYRNALVQQLVAIKQVTLAVQQMFQSTRESLETLGMDPTQLYNYWRSRADAVVAQIATETDPVRIGQLASLANQYFNNAINALPEDQRLSMRNPLLTWITDVDAFVQTRLRNIGGDLTAAGGTAFEAVRTALEGAADKMDKAAVKFESSSGSLETTAAAFATAVAQMVSQPLKVAVAGGGRRAVNA